MGNDGGSIPKRRELVKEAAKSLTGAQLKEAQTEQQEYAWSNDPLTRKPLSTPVVSDAAGFLYNKDSIIEFLLKNDDDAEKAELKKVGGVKGAGDGAFSELGFFGDRVAGLKDVVEVRFQVAEEGGKWVCPITNRELGHAAKAVYLVPCGHAFAGSVVREVAGGVCLQCNEPYAENDIIPILPTLPTDIARLNLRMKTLKGKGLTHALKKAPGSKKRKKHAEKELTSENTSNDTKPPDKEEHNKHSSSDTKQKEKKHPAVPTAPTPSNGIKNASTASLTRKVLQEQDERNKRRKLIENDNVKSLFSKSTSKPGLGNSADYMTRGFSIGKK